MKFIVKWSASDIKMVLDGAQYPVFKSKEFASYNEAKGFKEDLVVAKRTIGVKYYNEPRIEVEE